MKFAFWKSGFVKATCVMRAGYRRRGMVSGSRSSINPIAGRRRFILNHGFIRARLHQMGGQAVGRIGLPGPAAARANRGDQPSPGALQKESAMSPTAPSTKKRSRLNNGLEGVIFTRQRTTPRQRLLNSAKSALAPIE